MMKYSMSSILALMLCLSGCNSSVDQPDTENLSPETIQLVQLYSMAEARGPLKLDDPIIQEISKLTGRRKFMIGNTIYNLDNLGQVSLESCLQTYVTRVIKENGGVLRKKDIGPECLEYVVQGIKVYKVDIKLVD